MAISDPAIPLDDPRQRFIVCTPNPDGTLSRKLASRPGPAERNGHGAIIQRCASGDYVWQDAKKYLDGIKKPK